MTGKHNAAMNSKNARGFTLIELMIVMVIIAMLAALVGPRLMNALESSKVKTTKVQIEQLATTLDGFRLDVGRYPTQQEGLITLIQNTNPPIPNWRGPYLKKMTLPNDGWGQPFIYERPGKHKDIDYDLYSLGADGKPGGDGDNSDIGNWQ